MTIFGSKPCCGLRAPAPGNAPSSTLIVTGNPNVGKSVLFQLLTGRYVTVSNYPGTTVMVSTGTASLSGKAIKVQDTPGINSLFAGSEDEMLARDQILTQDKAAVLQVGDAKNLLRVLTLTLELAEAGVPFALCLNMIDEARERRVAIDTAELSLLLGVSVVPTIATQRWNVDRLRQAVPAASRSHARVVYPPLIVEGFQEDNRWRLHRKALRNYWSSAGRRRKTGWTRLTATRCPSSCCVFFPSRLNPAAVSSKRCLMRCWIKGSCRRKAALSS